MQKYVCGDSFQSRKELLSSIKSAKSNRICWNI